MNFKSICRIGRREGLSRKYSETEVLGDGMEGRREACYGICVRDGHGGRTISGCTWIETINGKSQWVYFVLGDHQLKQHVL